MKDGEKAGEKKEKDVWGEGEEEGRAETLLWLKGEGRKDSEGEDVAGGKKEELREEAVEGVEGDGGSVKWEEGKEKDEAKEDIEEEEEEGEPSKEDTSGAGEAFVKEEEEEGGPCVILFAVGSCIPFLDFGVTVRA